MDFRERAQQIMRGADGGLCDEDPVGDLAEYLREAHAAGFREGAEAMREEAAIQASIRVDKKGTFTPLVGQRLTRRIRSLPLPTPKENA